MRQNDLTPGECRGSPNKERLMTRGRCVAKLDAGVAFDWQPPAWHHLVAKNRLHTGAGTAGSPHYFPFNGHLLSPYQACRGGPGGGMEQALVHAVPTRNRKGPPGVPLAAVGVDAVLV